MSGRPGMRRRWRVRCPEFLKGIPPLARVAVFCGAWSGAGFVAFIIAGIVSMIETGNDLMNPFLNVVLAVGVGGPLAVLGVASAVWGLVWLVRHSPVRREWEPLPDLREEERC